jgi:hypothetical protein
VKGEKALPFPRFYYLHDGGVVDAGALGEDEDGQLGGVLHVLLQSLNKEKKY